MFVGVQAGRSELISRLKAQLRTWAPLLQKFLRSADDQVPAPWTVGGPWIIPWRICGLPCMLIRHACEPVKHSSILMWTPAAPGGAFWI